MKRIGIFVGIFCVVATSLMASSLDEAAFALYKGEVSETALENTFSKGDFEVIMEKYKGMRLERARKETEKQKVNELLKKRNIELEQEIKKIKDVNSVKKANIKKITIDEAIKNTFKGLYGDNPERSRRLLELGFTKKEVLEIQKAVNKIVEQEQNNKSKE